MSADGTSRTATKTFGRFPGLPARAGASALGRIDRPLYQSRRKSSRQPDAPIVVCEGEKAADAAARIFPKSIATTSSGGAQAADKTDWTPLAGRRVLIWPDNDEAGGKYAREVAAILAALECDVSIIDAAALAAIDPNGGKRAPAKGYDAADALAEWPDSGGCARWRPALPSRSIRGRPTCLFTLHDGRARGLAVEIERGRGHAKRMEMARIAAPFEVLGACRDPHGGGWGKSLRWRDDDGRVHVRHVADADLHGEPAALCAGLAHDGLRIDPARQRVLRRLPFAAAIETARNSRLADRLA